MEGQIDIDALERTLSVALGVDWKSLPVSSAASKTLAGLARSILPLRGGILPVHLGAARTVASWARRAQLRELDLTDRFYELLGFWVYGTQHDPPRGLRGAWTELGLDRRTKKQG